MVAVRDYKPPVFPFTALVGQLPLKLSLVLNVIHHGVMGVLIRGEKGTAKSTAARALADLLPEIEVVKGCHFGCDPHVPDHLLCPQCRKQRKSRIPFEIERKRVPFFTLPVNATEDTLVGSIDFEYAVKTGNKRFLPGLLAAVHRGFLYVDEVNLLDDHLVDLLLDVAASGVNIVEREGLSFVHPSEFILIGTMNPEEGDLRPQLLDRFGLCVQIEGITDTNTRVEIIKRREEFESDPIRFINKWSEMQNREREKIAQAIELFPQTHLTAMQLEEITGMCKAAGVAGHRADIVIERASRALAAYQGRTGVTEDDIKIAAFLALPHRMRNDMSELPQDKKKQQPQHRQNEEKASQQDQTEQPQEQETEPQPQNDSAQSGAEQKEEERQQGKPSEASAMGEEEPSNAAKPQDAPFEEEVFEIGKMVPINTRDLRHDRDNLARKGSGRRHRSRTDRKSGRYVRATMTRTNDDLALDATVRAAAPYQCRRNRNNLAICIEPQDIREKVRERKTSTLLVFVVDASGSMGTKLMTETKGAIMYLLMEAYQKRDRVCMLAFKGDGSEILLPPTDSIELAKQKLEELPTGGKTPLCSGLIQGYEVVTNSLRKNPDVLPLLVLITDGRANVGANRNRSYEGIFHSRLYEELYAVADAMAQEPRLRCMVIDAEEKRMGAFGKAQKLAERMGAKYLVLEEIRSGNIAKAVREELGR